MAIRTWASAGSTDANDPINWTGAGALLDTDTLVLDATSVAGCTLSGDLGAWSWDNDNGTVSGVTLGCAGIVIEAGYTGTLNLGTHRLAFGAGGLDCSAASAATVVGSAGSEIYVEGPSSGLAAFSLDGLAAYTLSNTLLYRSGRVELRGKAYSSSAIAQAMVSTIGSYALVSADAYVSAGGREFGTVDVAAGYSYYHKAMELMSTGQITGAGKMAMMIGGEPTVDPAAVIDVAAVTFYLYTGLGVVPAGTWSCGLFTIYFLTSDSYQIVPVGFADGVRFDCDLHITYSWQGTTTDGKEARLEFLGDCTIAGDFTYNVTSGLEPWLTATSTGSLTLDGTADQSIDSVADLALVVDKPVAGDLVLLPREVSLSDGSLAGDLTIAGLCVITLSGECNVGSLLDLAGNLSIGFGSELAVHQVTCRASGIVSGDGLLEIGSGGVVIESGGELSTSVLRLTDWNGEEVPDSFHGKLQLTSQTTARSSTFQLSGAMDWRQLDFIVGDAAVLVADCSDAQTVRVSGDISTQLTGAGKLRWFQGSETLELIGPGNQAVDLRPVEQVGTVSNQNSVGDVTFGSHLWVGQYDSVAGSNTIGVEKIHTTIARPYAVQRGCVTDSRHALAMRAGGGG